MKEKVYTLNAYGDDHKIVLRKSSYMNNGTLAVLMVEVFDDGHEEDWSNLTVNIADSDVFANAYDRAFIDTNNLGNSIVPWLVDNKIASVTGDIGFSGFCCYPLVEFNKKLINNIRSL